MCALDHMRKRRSISVLAARLVRPPTYLDRNRGLDQREQARVADSPDHREPLAHDVSDQGS